MHASRRRWILASAVAVLLLAARAQDAACPTKPIRFVIPFAPGGAADVLSRLVGAKLHEQLGQPIVYDNVPGAGSKLGVGRLARLPADGYSIGFGHTGSMAIGPNLYKGVRYEPLKDLTRRLRASATT